MNFFCLTIEQLMVEAQVLLYSTGERPGLLFSGPLYQAHKPVQ